ncbi:MAG: riboflavin synthase [Bacteroidetes bacterium]|nr:riboflavin synthase [Bacteroidota bacterium]
MFTGIIEALGKVEKIEQEQNNLHLYCSCPFTHELKIDQSVAHNGVCLTVVDINANSYKVTAIKETLEKTNLGLLKTNELLNLERCMPANGRFDGHIVQGHIDQTAICTQRKDEGGSTLFTFQYDACKGNITVEKGSVAVNGVSLTVVHATNDTFSVYIIPYTLTHTNFNQIQVGTTVNIEFDILGKYLTKLLKKQYV